MAILSGAITRLGRRALLGCLGVLCLLAPLELRAAEPTAAPSQEYKVKAAFLYNFASFVDWPTEAFVDPKAPFVIGVIGDDPFGNFLDQLVAGEKVGNRPIVVRRYERVDQAEGCQILYVSKSLAGTLPKLVASLHSHTVLTVGDSENFNQAGGIIRFVIENGKTRLHLNIDSAKATTLRISSKLMSLCRIVSGGGGDR